MVRHTAGWSPSREHPVPHSLSRTGEVECCRLQWPTVCKIVQSINQSIN